MEELKCKDYKVLFLLHILQSGKVTNPHNRNFPNSTEQIAPWIYFICYHSVFWVIVRTQELQGRSYKKTNHKENKYCLKYISMLKKWLKKYQCYWFYLTPNHGKPLKAQSTPLYTLTPLAIRRCNGERSPNLEIYESSNIDNFNTHNLVGKGVGFRICKFRYHCIRKTILNVDDLSALNIIYSATTRKTYDKLTVAFLPDFRYIHNNFYDFLTTKLLTHFRDFDILRKNSNYKRL
ncbi:hypothetical protein AGLY_000881 [Aphis glycines]|uniref:Uncharacterized protein n=1 Tax=Aphis glycines TaxID=307491 RepID=A0A6G0U887_APHGL|nr:hypothetical protein AGLY_000881 [Aphis glycines]